MKSTELRIGNWIYNHITGQHEQVLDVLCDSVNTHTTEYAPYSELDAIKLTTEILEKAGYKTIGKTNDYRKSTVILHHRERGYVVNKKVPIMESLHQLQNFHFALTGQELEFNL